jgi:hypothetical protein
MSERAFFEGLHLELSEPSECDVGIVEFMADDLHPGVDCKRKEPRPESDPPLTCLIGSDALKAAQLLHTDVCGFSGSQNSVLGREVGGGEGEDVRSCRFFPESHVGLLRSVT